MARPTSTAISLVLVMLVACGGKVVVDPPGAGGSSATSTTIGTSTTTGVPTGPNCDAYFAILEEANKAAIACNPAIDMIQCNGTAVVYDACGCPVVANELHPELVSTAVAEYNAWVGAGCGPYDCDTCPPGPGFGHFCDPGPAQCVPAYK